jgi:hypothetical protein
VSDQPLHEAAFAVYEAHHPGHACPECLEEVIALVLEQVTTTIEALLENDPPDGDGNQWLTGAEVLAAVRRLGDTP